MDSLRQRPAEVWKPVILDRSIPAQDLEYQRLLAQLPEGNVFDRILDQWCELAAIRSPKVKLTRPAAEAWVRRHLGERPIEQSGPWIFYSWSHRLVHVLPPAEFKEVRLDRNRNKITLAEQAQLARLSVGIIGLSAGNAIARALTLEGVCGRLKLADFDHLDLSNLNRLQAGLHELGINKAVVAARQIVELNPFADVTVWVEALSDENLDDFLLGQPALDIVIEECDSLDIKVRVRERARELHLPVLMQTSDRGMVDVERFDLEPGRPLFHGLAGQLEARQLKGLTTEEKVAPVLDIIGVDTMSARIAASLVEIDRTIKIWPQLGSEVLLGGATVTAAVRHLGLGRALPSGRRYVDLESILEAAPKPPGDLQPESLRVPEAKSATELTIHDSSASPFMRFLVEHAILAPSGGNCQPWRFFVESDQTLHVVHHRERSFNLQDRTHRGSMVALGAAVQNIVIAAAHRGRETEITPFPELEQPTWVATLRFRPGAAPALAELAAPFSSIRLRCTNRFLGEPSPMTEIDRGAFHAAAEAHGASLQILDERPAMTEIGRVVGASDRLRLLCPELHREMMAELRWTPEEAASQPDGIDVRTLELKASDLAAFRILRRPDVVALIQAQETGEALLENAAKAVHGASALGFLRINGDALGDFLQGGRALQSIWLEATRRGWAVHPMTSVIYLRKLVDLPGISALNPSERAELCAISETLDRIFTRNNQWPAVMLFRLLRASAPSVRAARRPIQEVLFAGRPVTASTVANGFSGGHENRVSLEAQVS